MWNNMDNAPRDGTKILAYVSICLEENVGNKPGKFINDYKICWFDNGYWQTDNKEEGFQLLRWMQIPSELKYTNRDFKYYKFYDYYRNECSLQESSLIADEYCVWLGREKNQEPHHVTGEEMSPRMHLTQSHAKWLGEKLIKFAETGELN